MVPFVAAAFRLFCFFQAEDGIRDLTVTGVQTCALPILTERLELFASAARFFQHGKAELFREESWVQVLLGQGFEAAPDPMVDLVPADQAMAFLKDIEEVIADNATRMLDHPQYIPRKLATQQQPAPTLRVGAAGPGAGGDPAFGGPPT